MALTRVNAGQISGRSWREMRSAAPRRATAILAVLGHGLEAHGTGRLGREPAIKLRIVTWTSLQRYCLHMLIA